MSTTQTLVRVDRARQLDCPGPVSRLVSSLRPFLPSVTSTRAAYRNQAAIFRKLGDAQSSQELSAAYYEAADALENLANN